jgi:hypothetical protein
MRFSSSSTFRLIQRQSVKSFGSTYTSAFATSAQSRLSTRKSFDKLNYNSDVSFEDSPGAYVDYDMVTANDLESYTAPPKRVKMLVRDFIEDSLYNPNYGYFPRHATIFTPSDNGIEFGSLRDSAEFENEVAKRYGSYGADEEAGTGKQLWHTPTELFKVNSTLSSRPSD